MTLLEVMVALVILTVCIGMLTSTITASQLHSVSRREKAIAVEEARGIFEDMHNLPFRQLYALYNADPKDDPGGPGTAPGKYFDVPGLDPVEGDRDGFVGEVILPAAVGPLREDAQDETLSMPRDLNGDLRIDEEDHASDYIVLPVRLELTWAGRAGERNFQLNTMLAEMEKLQ